MSAEVIIDDVTTQVSAFDGTAAIAPETLRQIAAALIPAVRAMLAHEQQVRNERSLDNGYADRLGRGAA